MMRTNPGEKVWTVVVEIAVEEAMPQSEIEERMSLACQDFFNAYKVMETIAAPYGPAGVSVKVK